MQYKLCVSCERPNAAPSQLIPRMCVRCVANLPQVTRMLYANGGLSLPRLTQISKERNASYRTIRRKIE